MFKVKTTKETKNSPSYYIKGDTVREVTLLSGMLRLSLLLLWFMAFPNTSYRLFKNKVEYAAEMIMSRGRRQLQSGSKEFRSNC